VIDGSTDRRLRGRRLDPRAVDEAGQTAWRDLADRAAEPNPFFRPEFLLANVIERDLAVELLVVTDGPRWIACLPVRAQPRTPRFPLSSLTALTDEYSFSGTPLLDRDALDAAADGLVRLVRAERRAAVLLIGVFESTGPVGRALTAAAARNGTRLTRLASFQRAGWRRSAEAHFPGPAFNRSDRRELARRTRLLAAEVGGEPLVVDRSQDPAAWDQFLAMENAGWKADRGTALGSTTRDAAFFRRMCAGMSAAGRLELVTLEVAGRTVAMECHLIDGPAFWSFKIAHDPAYRKFSPGTLLKYRVIDGLQERPFDLADSCAVPDNAHMNRLWPDRRTMETVMLPTRSRAARLVRPVLVFRAVARRARAVLRSRGRRPAEPATG
jgi:CelD/BcsL family acetyltransferase involved in cellulose biosynthesis